MLRAAHDATAARDRRGRFQLRRVAFFGAARARRARAENQLDQHLAHERGLPEPETPVTRREHAERKLRVDAVQVVAIHAFELEPAARRARPCERGAVRFSPNR